MTAQNWWHEQVAVARAIAYVAHKRQRRAGTPSEPYIDHVQRVAARTLLDSTCGLPAVCVAWLHDVIEDTPIDANDLAALGVDARVVRAVTLLTHPHGITDDAYRAYIERIVDESERWAWGRWARAVKIADAHDNLASVPALVAAEQHKLAGRLNVRYRAALRLLGAST